MAARAYKGRLAFDSDSGFHTEVIPGRPYEGKVLFDKDSKSLVSVKGEPVVTEDGGETWKTADQPGKRVVTDDEGKTWRYAIDSDPSHHERYHQRFAVIDTTANAPEPEPHHYEVQPDDPHFGGVQVSPDEQAATETSHTESWK